MLLTLGLRPAGTVTNERQRRVAVGGRGVWLAAWVWHMSASPDGIGLWQVLLHYRLLRHEQRARLERIQRELDR